MRPYAKGALTYGKHTYLQQTNAQQNTILFFFFLLLKEYAIV